MNRSRFGQQQRFHDNLGRYVNGAFSRRHHLAFFQLAPRLTYRLAAPGLVAEFRALRAGPPGEPVTADEFDVPLYTGANAQTKVLMEELEQLSPWLAGAYVHGSVATGEEVPYSDYDALVILKRQVLESEIILRRVAWKLGSLRRLMFQYDPLQHHGWFVLVDSDLDEYCDAWFPTALLPWSRSLLHGVGQRLVIRSRPCGEDYLAAFHELARNTLRRIEAGPSTDDAYQVKSLLSQIMLLPALYLQARDGTAVFKKFSFDLAARDFPPATWEAMNRISAVRDHWHVELGGLRRLAMTRLVTHRRLVTRWLSPRVPDDLQRRLKGNTWQAVTALIHAMEERLADAAKVRPQLASGRGT